MLKKLAKIFLYFCLLVLTWAMAVYHRGVFPKPTISRDMLSKPSFGQWIPKERDGINHLIVQGTAIQRGELAGHYTKDLLQRQEKELVEKLNLVFTKDIYRHLFEVVMIRWFWGIEKYFEPWMIEEMYGVSLSAPKEFDYLGDGLTRQVTYHGLHEVGQMFVDQKSDDMGCTVVAAPLPEGGWIIGRNFDFEGGRVFDSEKILKWVFPEKGNAYVSVIWAGMVGAVTGVNEKGLYISLNAAGTEDFARFGTPSTLILTKALMNANTADEAVEIIKNEKMFITDIFAISDGQEFYRVEKSPKRFAVIPHEGTVAIANHLIAPIWNGDKINLFRKFELTSDFRSVRAEELLKNWDGQNPENKILKILRDKGDSGSGPFHLGNRRAIDSLVATHAVIYNQATKALFVSHGPSLAGGFTGYSLEKSFAAHNPIVTTNLDRDTDLSDEVYDKIKEAAKFVSSAERKIKKQQCDEAFKDLVRAENLFSETSDYYLALGNYHQCKSNIPMARAMWNRSLEMHPAYSKQVDYLKGKLQK